MELEEYVAEWYTYADRDLATAEYLCGMYPQPLEIICYHCQQAAEKYLKAYLVFREGQEPPKTHDLTLLSIECSKTESRFENVGRACEMLTRYGVLPRYPTEIEVFENDMQKALEYARQIRDVEPLAELRLRISRDDSKEKIANDNKSEETQ